MYIKAKYGQLSKSEINIGQKDSFINKFRPYSWANFCTDIVKIHTFYGIEMSGIVPHVV